MDKGRKNIGLPSWPPHFSAHNFLSVDILSNITHLLPLPFLESFSNGRICLWQCLFCCHETAAAKSLNGNEVNVSKR